MLYNQQSHYNNIKFTEILFERKTHIIYATTPFASLHSFCMLEKWVPNTEDTKIFKKWNLDET